MEMLLISVLVLTLVVSQYINWQRHRNDFRGNLYWSKKYEQEKHGNIFGQKAYDRVNIIREAGRNESGRLYLVRFASGYEACVSEGWMLRPEELPPTVY